MSRPPLVADGRLRCGNASRGGLLARDLVVLESRLARFRQAAFRRLGPDQGLFLEPAPAVHSFFAREALVVVFLDRERRVQAVVDLPRFRALPAPAGSRSAMLLPASTAALRPRPGDRLELLAAQPRAPGREAAGDGGLS
ncbi:MAG: hypothetical protein D6702_12675 [Planctomycetota bacterium]|nr:MAG: hypothetical protein D6702_12675 [Planctomycetota bacterium]